MKKQVAKLILISFASATVLGAVGMQMPARAEGGFLSNLVSSFTGGVGGGSGGGKANDGAPNKNDSVEGMQERRWAYLNSAEGAGARASSQPDFGFDGSDIRDAKGTAQSGIITGAKLNGQFYSVVPPMPLATITFPVAAKAQENEMYNHCPPLTGYHLTDSADYINSSIANDVLLSKVSDPERWMHVAKATQQAQNTQLGNQMAELARNQANSAIDYCASYMTNFTTSKQWNNIRDRLFIPMAILLLLPGAMLAQVRSIVAAGNPVLEESSPFEGLLRSIVAIFLIPATCLVLNYGIDLSNSITYTMKTEYQNIFHDDMYQSAICAQVRAFPVRQEAENRGEVDQPTTKMGQLLPEQKTTFAKVEGKLFSIKLEDPCAGLYIAPKDRVDEALPTDVVAARLAFNTINAGLCAGWNALCAFQTVYMYYLWLLGPIVAALWVWPLKMFRDALPSWVEGCVTLCFWSLLWNTTILLMACFRGYDETGTIVMTALNTLATLCVKCAFDFVGLVAQAGAQASSIGGELTKAMKSGAEGAKGAGAGSGSGGGGRASRSAPGAPDVHGGGGHSTGTGGGAGLHGSPAGGTHAAGEGGGADLGTGSAFMPGGAGGGHLSLTSHASGPMGAGSALSAVHDSGSKVKLSDIVPPPGSGALTGHAGGQAAASGMIHNAMNALHSAPIPHIPMSEAAAAMGHQVNSHLNAASHLNVGGQDIHNMMHAAAAAGAAGLHGIGSAGSHNHNSHNNHNNQSNHESVLSNLQNLAHHNNAGFEFNNQHLSSSMNVGIGGDMNFVWNSANGAQIDIGSAVDIDNFGGLQLGADIDIAAGQVIANADFDVDMNDIDNVTQQASNIMNAAGNVAGDDVDVTNNSAMQNALAADILNNSADGDSFNSVMNDLGDNTQVNANLANVNSAFDNSVSTAFSSSMNSAISSSVSTTFGGAVAGDVVNAANSVAQNMANSIANSIGGDIVNTANNMAGGVQNSFTSSGFDVTNSSSISSSMSANMATTNVSNYDAGSTSFAGGNSAAYDIANNVSQDIDYSNGGIDASSSYDIANASASMSVDASTQLNSYDASQQYSQSHQYDSSQSYASYDSAQNYQQSQQYDTSHSYQQQYDTQHNYQSAPQYQTASYQSQSNQYADNSSSSNVAQNVGAAMQSSIANSLTSNVVQGQLPMPDPSNGGITNAQQLQQSVFDSQVSAAGSGGSVATGSQSSYETGTASIAQPMYDVSYGSNSGGSSGVAQSQVSYDSGSSSSPSTTQYSSSTDGSSSSVQYNTSQTSSSAPSPETVNAAAGGGNEIQSEYARATMMDQPEIRSLPNGIPVEAATPAQHYSSAPAASMPEVPFIVPIPPMTGGNSNKQMPSFIQDTVKQSVAPKEEKLASQSAKGQSKLASALRGAGVPLAGADKKGMPPTSQKGSQPQVAQRTNQSSMPPSSKASKASPMDISALNTANRYRKTQKLTEEEIQQLRESTEGWWV